MITLTRHCRFIDYLSETHLFLSNHMLQIAASMKQSNPCHTWDGTKALLKRQNSERELPKPAEEFRRKSTSKLVVKVQAQNW